jgi:hypothetical protein
MIAHVFLISNEKDEFEPSVVPLRPLAFQDRSAAQDYLDDMKHRVAKKMRVCEYWIVEEKA